MPPSNDEGPAGVDGEQERDHAADAIRDPEAIERVGLADQVLAPFVQRGGEPGLHRGRCDAVHANVGAESSTASSSAMEISIALVAPYQPMFGAGRTLASTVQVDDRAKVLLHPRPVDLVHLGQGGHAVHLDHPAGRVEVEEVETAE
jgi:hypothetical protein